MGHPDPAGDAGPDSLEIIDVHEPRGEVRRTALCLRVRGGQRGESPIGAATGRAGLRQFGRYHRASTPEHPRRAPTAARRCRSRARIAKTIIGKKRARPGTNLPRADDSSTKPSSFKMHLATTLIVLFLFPDRLLHRSGVVRLGDANHTSQGRPLPAMPLDPEAQRRGVGAPDEGLGRHDTPRPAR
jgi:hypothetical protein